MRRTLRVLDHAQLKSHIRAVKRAVFVAIMVAIPAAFLASSAALLLPRIKAGLRPFLLQHMANSLTQDERDEIYERIAQGTSFWDAVPDPDVGGLAQRNRTLMDAGAEVRTNNAGLRAARDYSAKPEGTFRILCLGDSFVFGMGGLEQDRFLRPAGSALPRAPGAGGGRSIEALAIGLPGWTLVQQTTYLATRITSYDPDLILVLSVANDITDNFGVTGVGTLTRGFSSEHRALGSSVFADDLNVLFGDTGPRSALAWDLSPESRGRWDKAMQRLKRLVEIQQGRGKHILVSAMAWGQTSEPDAYPVLFQSQFLRVGIPAPYVMTSFLPSSRTTLSHDSHPNRLGHTLLRDH